MIAMRKTAGKAGQTYEPTPKDIQRECERIRAAWSPRERAKRAGLPKGGRWTPPSIHLSVIADAAGDDWVEGVPYWAGPSNGS
jgi:hypothetical protein